MSSQKLSSSYAYTLLKNAPFIFKQSNAFATPKSNLQFGQTIHAHLIKNHESLFKTNTLINFYVKHGQISSARRLFDEMSERNVVSWSTLMAGCLHSGLSSEALLLFATMMNGSLMHPNEYILTTVMSSCSNIRAFREGWQCHAYALKSGLASHTYVMNALIYMYSKCSDVDGALEIFKSSPSVDSFASNSVIYGLMENGYFNEALEILYKMVKSLVLWDSVTYATALGLSACLKDLRMGLQLHNQVMRRDMEHSLYVSSALVDMYGKCGKVASARNIFYQLQLRNVVSWTAIMTAYAHNGLFEVALNMFSAMLLDGVRPNEFSYAMLLNSCASLSTLTHGDVLNAHVQKSGSAAYLVVGNALINMYSKSGSISSAHVVFTGMPFRDVVSWNSMISGFSHHGLGRDALAVFKRMLTVGVAPNYVTFVGVLSACSHLGHVNEGYYILNHLMKEKGVTPGVEHYTCVLGLLSRAGLLEEAENFMRVTPIEWDVVAWRTLLSACVVHRNYGLGKRVAEIILELNPDDVGTYILLSNMYAKARRWDGVVKIRKMMRERDIKKEPGVSWIQVRGSTHVFVSEDKQHPQSSMIYEKLAELIAKIKILGYVPDIANVLHDVEDEKKEECLRYHSEKLAVTFGIIYVPLGAPIYVIKNIRMCEDCHTAVKLISVITNRKLIIRDANRYHSFERGICSCGNYW